MEGKILLLENFGLISVTMPYYGHTHKGFLLLSKLWVKTRMKLDEFYVEFRRHMIPYWWEIELNDHKYSRPFPPWDLFRLNFMPINEGIKAISSYSQ